MQAHLETESKFCLRRLEALSARLKQLGAECIVPRAHEYNLRFDSSDHRLSETHQVLRLRRMDDVRLTYKAQSTTSAGVRTRTEIELIVSDFETAQRFLEALGYTVVWIYEKYRAMYRLETALITLDETPIGNFAEIEAPSVEAVLQYARRLGLDPAAALPHSYHELFQRAAARMQVPPRDLTFRAFADAIPTPAEIGLPCAD